MERSAVILWEWLTFGVLVTGEPKSTSTLSVSGGGERRGHWLDHSSIVSLLPLEDIHAI